MASWILAPLSWQKSWRAVASMLVPVWCGALLAAAVALPGSQVCVPLGEGYVLAVKGTGGGAEEGRRLTAQHQSTGLACAIKVPCRGLTCAVWAQLRWWHVVVSMM